MRRLSAFLFLPLIAACTAVPPPSQPGPQRPPVVRPPSTGVPPTRAVRPPQVGFRAPQILRLPGLEGVIEQSSASLVRQFGNPRLDVAEGDMRKLQFAGQACVLDVFLYPMREGRATARTSTAPPASRRCGGAGNANLSLLRDTPSVNQGELERA